MEYRWPGNVRELEDSIQAAALLSDGDTISRSDIESQVKGDASPNFQVDTAAPNTLVTLDFADGIVQGNFNKLSREFEQRLVRYSD